MRRLALLAWLASVSACGGSSSETPPPLEPDPARLRGAGGEGAPEELAPPAPGGASSNAGSAGVIAPVSPPPPAAPPLELPPVPRRVSPARSTWGAAPARGRAPELAPEPEN